jgi:hypothetical protein
MLGCRFGEHVVLMGYFHHLSAKTFLDEFTHPDRGWQDMDLVMLQPVSWSASSVKSEGLAGLWLASLLNIHDPWTMTYMLLVATPAGAAHSISEGMGAWRCSVISDSLTVSCGCS